MKIKAGKTKGYPSLEISGEIIGESASEIAKKLEILRKKDTLPIVVDFSNVTMIDSYGLGALVYAWKQFQEESRKLIFLCQSPFDREFFTSASLDRIFTIVYSVEEL
jgi:anti-anti-sigma factor